MEHGSRMRHQSKNPEYVAKLGVNNGVKGSGNPYIDQDLSTGNETILVGKQVILRCHIEDVKGKSVRTHCCMKCPQILREKTSSEKYTVFSL